MTEKTKVIIVVVIASAIVGFSFQTYKKKTETHINETKTQDKTTETDKHVETKVVEIIAPDGTKTTTTETVEDTKKHRDSTTVTEKQKDQTVEVSRGEGSKVSISALVGTSLTSLGTPVYGATVSKPILGPITVGLWGLSSGTGGISVGLTF